MNKIRTFLDAHNSKKRRIKLGEDVKELLQLLGQDAESIAASLENLGIRGHLHEPDSCPITVFLEGELNLPVRAGTGSCSFVYKNTRSFVLFPAPVSIFIRKFDSGNYPNLVKNDEPASS